MARLAFVALLAIAFVAQPGYSKPKPEAASTNFEDLVKEIQTSIDKTLADAKKSLNLPNEPNGDAIVKAIKEQNKKAETALNDMKAKIEQQLKNTPEIQEAIKTLQSKIDEAKDKLKKESPEVAANAQKVIDGVKSAYGTVTKELEKISQEVNKKGGVKDDLETLLKKLIDSGTVAAKDLQNKVQEAIKETNKKQ